jgi:hypothetical protein
MEKVIHDQSKARHIIYVPMPFTEEGLKYIVAVMNGWEDQPDVVQDYVDAIIQEETMSLNPSSHLGEGANIVDIFSFGLMAITKAWQIPPPDINQLWWHPCRNKIPLAIKSIEVEDAPCEVISHEEVMYEAIDANSGKVISAKQLMDSEETCQGNRDHLEKYGEEQTDDNEDGLPF